MSDNRISTTALSFTSAMRVLAKDGPLTTSELAKRDNRVTSNIRRDAPKLVEAGYVEMSGDRLSLTDKGRQWVVGQDIAEGRQSPSDPDRPSAHSHIASRWPVENIRPNPLNRTVTPEGLEELALSIVGAGDILQPLILTPADANGVRTILAGERRWRAACALRADGAEVSALEEGVPFIEREADDAETVLITLIENSQRLDLTPWQDAQQLLKLADATGWNGTELARRIGRADAEGRKRVRDVQTKLKVAREATPEAIAEYEANGSWDRLRDSISKPKGPETKHLALMIVEAALLADDTRGVWDGLLTLESGLIWPESWLAKWFGYNPDNGSFTLHMAALDWLTDEGLGDDPEAVLMRHRTACGMPHRTEVRPFVTEQLNWSPTPDAASDETPLPLETRPASNPAISEAERDILRSYAWRELLHKIQHQPASKPNATEVGAFWKHADAIAMQQAGLIILAPQPGAVPLAILTDKAITARNAQAMLWGRNADEMMTDDDLSNHPDSPAIFTGTYATEWLAHIPVAAMNPPDEATPEPVQTDVEEVAEPRSEALRFHLSESDRLAPRVMLSGKNEPVICIDDRLLLSAPKRIEIAHLIINALNAAEVAA